MSLLLTGGAAATVVIAGYIGRKSWLAFHRAVGITPGTMVYSEPSQLPPPTLMQLSLTPKQLQHLPPVIIEQLTRIDHKADLYQSWKTSLAQSGQTPPTCENEFIVSKLLSTRLPEMIDSYQRIANHEQRLHPKPSAQHNEAAALLMDMLQHTETKLDRLLDGYKSASLQDMQVMQRYLDDR